VLLLAMDSRLMLLTPRREEEEEDDMWGLRVGERGEGQYGLGQIFKLPCRVTSLYSNLSGFQIVSQSKQSNNDLERLRGV
jgi:hypothetical protein